MFPLFYFPGIESLHKMVQLSSLFVDEGGGMFMKMEKSTIYNRERGDKE